MTVGAYEAKTHLSELLARVAGGERITITKHGVPVAVLQSPDPVPTKNVRQVLAGIRSLREELRRRGALVPQAEIRTWLEEGRD